ncbi:transposase, MuDR, MULE transposase domain protein [Tanacetum coccineum]
MPEEMLVGQCLPPYYISQLGDCIIISGSFKFVDFSIIYAWELQVDDGEVSWYRKLFTLRYPIEHDLKLIGFTKDKQPIVEASFVQQLHQSLQKVVNVVGEDADFNSGAWVSATNYVNAFGGTVTGCLGDIDNFLKRGKLEQVVAIVKSCSPNALGDLNVTLKDLSGTVPGTINYKVLDMGSYGKDINVGAAMILANVSVFIFLNHQSIS